MSNIRLIGDSQVTFYYRKYQNTGAVKAFCVTAIDARCTSPSITIQSIVPAQVSSPSRCLSVHATTISRSVVEHYTAMDFPSKPAQDVLSLDSERFSQPYTKLKT